MGHPRPSGGYLGQLRGLFGGVAHVVRLAVRREHRSCYQSIKGKVFFFVKTDNQGHAVQPVVELLGQEAVKSDLAFLGWLFHRGARLSLPFLPVLLFRWLTATVYQRRTLPHYVADYWLSYGLFLAACEVFRSKPNALVVSNDHTVVPRSIARAANFRHIPTVFIPHAGVMKGLPPLCFDFAFLEGLVAVQRYREFGPTQTAILLAGNCRLDFVLRKPLPGPGAILFCPSLGDEVSAILESVSKVLAAIPDGTVILRPHPRDPMRETYLEASKKLGCVFSDAREQRAEAALIPVNAVVCGDSNIILEAKLTRRWVAVFFASGSISDHYGYIAEGIPDAVCWHAGEVIEFLRNTYTSEPPLFDGINRFMSTSGTCWEGRSAELIAESLRDLTGIQSQYGSVLWERVDACPQQQVFIPRQGGCAMPTRGRVAGG
jgi:hypothetical protein